MNKYYISNQRYSFMALTAKSTLLTVNMITERGLSQKNMGQKGGGGIGLCTI